LRICKFGCVSIYGLDHRQQWPLRFPCQHSDRLRVRRRRIGYEL
jgi:hypothetical protein